MNLQKIFLIILNYLLLFIFLKINHIYLYKITINWKYFIFIKTGRNHNDFFKINNKRFITIRDIFEIAKLKFPFFDFAISVPIIVGSVKSAGLFIKY